MLASSLRAGTMTEISGSGAGIAGAGVARVKEIGDARDIAESGEDQRGPGEDDEPFEDEKQAISH